ncbi:hypothetical protein WA158_006600 [Blastocystis sp. Blastoise]
MYNSGLKIDFCYKNLTSTIASSLRSSNINELIAEDKSQNSFALNIVEEDLSNDSFVSIMVYRNDTNRLISDTKLNILAFLLGPKDHVYKLHYNLNQSADYELSYSCITRDQTSFDYLITPTIHGVDNKAYYLVYNMCVPSKPSNFASTEAGDITFNQESFSSPVGINEFLESETSILLVYFSNPPTVIAEYSLRWSNLLIAKNIEDSYAFKIYPKSGNTSAYMTIRFQLMDSNSIYTQLLEGTINNHGEVKHDSMELNRFVFINEFTGVDDINDNTYTNTLPVPSLPLFTPSLEEQNMNKKIQMVLEDNNIDLDDDLDIDIENLVNDIHITTSDIVPSINDHDNNNNEIEDTPVFTPNTKPIPIESNTNNSRENTEFSKEIRLEDIPDDVRISNLDIDYLLDDSMNINDNNNKHTMISIADGLSEEEDIEELEKNCKIYNNTDRYICEILIDSTHCLPHYCQVEFLSQQILFYTINNDNSIELYKLHKSSLFNVECNDTTISIKYNNQNLYGQMISLKLNSINDNLKTLLSRYIMDPKKQQYQYVAEKNKYLYTIRDTNNNVDIYYNKVTGQTISLLPKFKVYSLHFDSIQSFNSIILTPVLSIDKYIHMYSIEDGIYVQAVDINHYHEFPNVNIGDRLVSITRNRNPKPINVSSSSFQYILDISRDPLNFPLDCVYECPFYE